MYYWETNNYGLKETMISEISWRDNQQPVTAKGTLTDVEWVHGLFLFLLVLKTIAIMTSQTQNFLFFDYWY